AGVALAYPPSLRTGFTDDNAYQQLGGSDRVAALQHTRDARGSLVRLFVHWAEVAPAKPPTDALARDPAWPGYRWDRLDSVLRAVRDAGLEPVLAIHIAPAWAEGARRPPVSHDAPAGTWRPSPSAYGAFAEAAARRYSG